MLLGPENNMLPSELCGTEAFTTTSNNNNNNVAKPAVVAADCRVLVKHRKD